MEPAATPTINNKYLRMALRKIESEDFSEKIQHRHVAVIAKAGRILAVGRNRNKTHPESITLDENGDRILKTIHAELDAIFKVKNKEQLKGATIYVARLGRGGDPGMSCPCTMCQALINRYGLKRAVFTTDYGTGTLDFTGEAA
jgi:deoxycytidylate deaminase